MKSPLLLGTALAALWTANKVLDSMANFYAVTVSQPGQPAQQMTLRVEAGDRSHFSVSPAPGSSLDLDRQPVGIKVALTRDVDAPSGRVSIEVEAVGIHPGNRETQKMALNGTLLTMDKTATMKMPGEVCVSIKRVNTRTSLSAEAVTLLGLCRG